MILNFESFLDIKNQTLYNSFLSDNLIYIFYIKLSIIYFNYYFLGFKMDNFKNIPKTEDSTNQNFPIINSHNAGNYPQKTDYPHLNLR
jgi:hypothetical protein